MKLCTRCSRRYKWVRKWLEYFSQCISAFKRCKDCDKPEQHLFLIKYESESSKTTH